MKNMIGFVTAVVMFMMGASGLAAADDMLGKETYEKWCLPCHAAGESYPGTWKLALRSDGNNAVLAERKGLSAEYIKVIVRQGFGGMPLFRRVEISERELDALAEYLVRP